MDLMMDFSFDDKVLGFSVQYHIIMQKEKLFLSPIYVLQRFLDMLLSLLLYVYTQTGQKYPLSIKVWNHMLFRSQLCNFLPVGSCFFLSFSFGLLGTVQLLPCLLIIIHSINKCICTAHHTTSNSSFLFCKTQLIRVFVGHRIDIFFLLVPLLLDFGGKCCSA